MLLSMCKSCQYCLETVYWKCCEERCCFDTKIAAYRFEDVDAYWPNGYANMGASLDSVVTAQPANNNHLPQEAILDTRAINREVTEMPINADVIYEVFSKSMIFRDEVEFNKSRGSGDSLDELETKSEPDLLANLPNRTKVYFEDEVDDPITDFEIMFKDELIGNYKMFKIEEEEETDNKNVEEDGLTMNVELRKPGHDLVKPSSITIRHQPKITTQNPIYEYDPTLSLTNSPSTLTLPKVESVKSILRQNRELPRSHSARNLTRIDSSSKLYKQTLNRVESLKNIDTKQINQLLSRVPQRSASFLNVPDHLLPENKILNKSDSVFTISSNADSLEFAQLSRLPDTPIIKSGNLPKFFTDSPALSEYKGETSLQSIKQMTDVIFKENDYSMPRYYGKVPIPVEPAPVHESKSMPDLRSPSTSEKVSKRLVKIRSKLKPLVIKKGTEDKL